VPDAGQVATHAQHCGFAAVAPGAVSCYASAMAMHPIPILASIAELAATSDAWIVDIWGVMHNGERAYATAAHATRAFRAAGGTVVLLSNAPRPFQAVEPHMAELGVPADAYDAGVTSGDVTRDMLKAWAGRRLLHIGPERDRPLLDGLEVRLAPAAEAEVVLCSGLYNDDTETPADYAGTLATLATRRVPMICANPDILVERGHKLLYCAGALAQNYAAKGGEVAYAGKPHLPVYERTLAEIARLRGRPVAKERVLCIGDGVETDLGGAHAAGLRSVFVASPIFAPSGLSPDLLGELFAERPFAPVAAMRGLAW
jgi:HAD superfamily hydrolase (TIGR01459 family)